MTDAAAVLSRPEVSPSDGGFDPEQTIIEAIRKEYKYYCSDVKFWVDMVEVYYDHTPDGLAYEVRAFAGHIGDALIRTDRPVEDRLKNVQDAHTHLRRIILDCLKTVGIWQRDQFKAFDKKYRWTDLSDVNDGKFSPAYAALKKKAYSSFRRAKEMERPGKNDQNAAFSDDVYVLYFETYNANSEVLKYLDEHSEAIDRVAHRSVTAKIITGVSLLVGIAGTIFGYISFTRPCP